MEEHLQRLRQYLTQGGLTATDARDGMVAAYLVISRLNQLQGNSDVGLKENEAGLYQHFSGFMGAIFWERGYNYDHPTVQQLSEVKMMLDGTAQIFSMPENLQMALNEICDFLLARAGNQPAVVSSAVMDLLESHTPDQIAVAPEIKDFDFSAPKNVPEPAIVPESVAEPVPEPEPVPESVAEPVPEPEPVPESIAEPGAAEPETQEPAALAPPAEKPASASAELEPELVALFDEAMKEESKPAAPAEAPRPETPAGFEFVESTIEPAFSSEETPQFKAETTASEMPAEPARFGIEVEPAGVPLPAESAPGAPGPEEPVKKKRGRKKAAETSEPKTKASRKKTTVAKTGRDAGNVVVPGNYMQTPAPSEPAAPVLAYSEATPEPEPVYHQPAAEPVAEFTPEPESVYHEPAAEPVAEFAPEPEPAAEPVSVTAPESLPIEETSAPEIA